MNGLVGGPLNPAVMAFIIVTSDPPALSLRTAYMTSE